MDKLPFLEPYIRISTLFQALGHSTVARKDFTIKTIAKVDYMYYPYFTGIFRTARECLEYSNKEQIDEPLMTRLCNKYI
jgi:hypothetical protein